MKSSIFQDAVESSTRVFGRKQVGVVFEGSEARTNGDTVVLPALPPAADITVDQADVIRGYRDHEAIHVRCTDTSPQILNKLRLLGREDKNLEQLAQYCEDIRIEHAGIKEYPGMKHNLSAVNKEAAKGVIEQLESYGDPAQVIANVPPIMQFRVALQSLGRKKLGIELGAFEQLLPHIKAASPRVYDLAEKFSDEMLKLPTGYDDKKGILDEHASKKGTTDAMDLARAIYDAYGQFEKEPEPPEPQSGDEQQQPGGGQGEGNGEGFGQQPSGNDSGDEASDDAGSGEGEGSGEGGGGGDEQGSGQDGSQDGSQGSDQGQQGEGNGSDDGGASGGGAGFNMEKEQGKDTGESAGGSGGNGAGNSTYAPMGQDTKDQLAKMDLNLDYKKALNDVVEDITGKEMEIAQQNDGMNGTFMRFSNKLSLKLPIMQFGHIINGNAGSPNGFLNRATKIADKMEKEITGKRAMIRRLLELELQARHDRRWTSGHRAGRLHSVRLVDAMQGKAEVYQRRTEGKDMDTLLRIGVDGSGSMAGPRAIESMQLAMALSEALERTGCDIEVLMYGDPEPDGWPGVAWGGALIRKLIEAWSDDLRKRNLRGHSQPKFSTIGHLVRAVIKSQRQRTSDPSVKAAFGAGAFTLHSSTPSVDATFSDLADLAKEPHSKKIYLHITDGQPDGCLEGQSNEALMHEAQRLADSIGVHMIGVGISGMDVSHMFRDHLTVSGVDMYEPVIRKLAKLIAKEVGHGTRSFKRAA